MCTSLTYVYSREIKLKIKVTNEDGDILQKARIGVDRDTTSLEKLKSHLIKSLKLRSKFILKYQTTKRNGDRTMVITDDWDLDAALQQCRHSMKITVQVYSDHDLDEAPGNCEHLLTESDEHSTGTKAAGDGVTSMLDRLMDKMENLFSFNDSSHHLSPSKTKSPMTFREFHNYLDAEGRLENYRGFRESIYHGGIAPSMRKIAWRHLLCAFPEDMTAEERLEYLKEKSTEYICLRDSWKKEYKANKEDMSEHMRFVTTMVKKDVVRTDRNTSYYKGREDNKHTMSLFDLLCTYALNHPNVSYCQGMCDLASPILAVQDNEAHAYLLFCSLMQRMKYNFSFDSIAISIKFKHLTHLLSHFDPEFYAYLEENQVENLLFAYRWLLLEMKREFAFEDSLYFMEVMWSSLPMLPSRAEVPLFEELDMANAISAYERENNLDSDTESFITTSSSALSDFQDCGHVSPDNSLVLKQECIERALMGNNDSSDNVFSSAESDYSSDETSNGDHLISEFYRHLESVENEELTSLECNCTEHQSRRQSVDSVTHDDDDDAYTTQSLCGQRPGSDSVDSGFGSRPSSPIRHENNGQKTLNRVQSEEEHDHQYLFPPPKAFGYGNPFLMFAALAMILEQRDAIMDKEMDFNDIVMLFSGYKSQNDVHTILHESRQLYEAYMTDGLEFDEEDYEQVEVSADAKD